MFHYIILNYFSTKKYWIEVFSALLKCFTQKYVRSNSFNWRKRRVKSKTNHSGSDKRSSTSRTALQTAPSTGKQVELHASLDVQLLFKKHPLTSSRLADLGWPYVSSAILGKRYFQDTQGQVLSSEAAFHQKVLAWLVRNTWLAARFSLG